MQYCCVQGPLGPATKSHDCFMLLCLGANPPMLVPDWIPNASKHQKGGWTRIISLSSTIFMSFAIPLFWRSPKVMEVAPVQLNLALGARFWLLLFCLCYGKIVFVCLLMGCRESGAQDVELQNLSDKPVLKISFLAASHYISSPCSWSRSGYY